MSHGNGHASLQITSKQAAQILGRSISTIRTLRDQGVLVDTRPLDTRPTGTAKQFSLYDLRQVELLKENGLPRHRRERRDSGVPRSGPTQRRLDAIDSKLDRLITILATGSRG